VGETQTKCHLLLCNFHTKKAWVDNLLPKVGENEIDDLYKAMCTLMDAESKIEIEENYNTFKEDYGHLAVVMRYVDVGWAGQNCYCRTMWTRFGRLFPHEFVDTTNLVERMWHFIKYTLLRRKFNRRLDELVLSIIGDPSLNGERMGGMTLIEHYRERQMISESDKYTLRGSTKSHTNKLQKAQYIFEKYLENPNEVLREVDIFGLIFEMKS
jgi:hypothetical protein